ncbi:MAG: hypothetical protein ACOZIN_10560 [Myxococcota bacterium]
MRLRAFWLLLLTACGTRGDLFVQPLTPLPLLATRSALVQVVPQTSRAVVLKPPQAPVDLELSAGARVAAHVPGSELVLVLAGSLREPRLDVVDTQALTAEHLEVPGLFDAIHLSPDGQHAVLTYSATTSGTPLAARNLNEIALVELSSRTVTRIQLDTESLAPHAVVYGPDEAARRLVAVALDRGVALFDAKRPTEAPRRISIRPQGVPTEATVLEALFSQDARFLFLRASGLDDVIVVELEPSAQGVSASINFVAGGQGLADIDLSSGGVLAVYAQSKEALRLDPRGIIDNVLRLPLPDTYNAVRPLSNERVLLFGPSTKQVTAWDVTDGRSGTAVLDGVGASVGIAEPLGKALFAHGSLSAGGGSALSILTVEDAATRLRARIQSIQLVRPASVFALDERKERLFFAADGDGAVVTLDLRTLQLAQVSLDASPRALFHLPEGDWLAAVHSNIPLGDVTFVPAGSQDRTQALRYSYFGLTGDLDRATEGL